MKVLVSACIMGGNCNYNSRNSYNPPQVATFLAVKETVMICPEILAGFGSPRNCVEIVNEKIVDINSKDVDEEYRRGIELALKTIQNE